MEVVRITPRGYCHGVVKALQLVMHAINDPTLPRPIYILGQIVHNTFITAALQEKNVITLDGPGKTRLELLDTIASGTVIFTAHGVAPAVYKKAKEKQLTCIDATCIDVTHTHQILSSKLKEGYDIIYIGKKGHPEPEGALGIHPDRIHFVETINDIAHLTITTKRIAITNQTTLSLWDVAQVARAIQEQYPQAIFLKEICHATQVRQEAVAEQAKLTDVVLVVGDPRSNNTNRLVQIAQEAGVPAYRVAHVNAIEPTWLIHKKRVGVTAGASTPTKLTLEVIRFLEQYDPQNPISPPQHTAPADVLPKVKKKV